MINGYVTFDELKIITGYNSTFLRQLLVKGLNYHEIHLDNDLNLTKDVKSYTLFNLREVEEWFKAHVF